MDSRMVAWLAVLAMLSGCATTAVPPSLPAAAPGHQLLRVGAVTWTETQPDFPGRPVTYNMVRVDGVRCIARNAKGSWETTTPGSLEVAIGEGAGTLRIDCEREGYEAVHAEFACVTPRTRSTAGGAMAGLQLIGALGPAAVYAAPAAVVAALAGSVFAGAAVGSAAAGPDPDVCNYTEHSAIGVRMTPKRP